MSRPSSAVAAPHRINMPAPNPPPRRPGRSTENVARRSGVTAIVQPGGSIRDQQVIDTCNKYGIAMAFCGIRLFHH